MTRVVALDIATVTGVAVGEPGARPRAWAHRLDGGSQSARFASAMRLMHSILAEERPDQVIFESPLAVMGKGGSSTIRLLIGLPACMEGVCAMRGTRVFEVATATWRKHFLGVGRLDRKSAKQAAMTRCRQLGWEFGNDDNAAEALGIWDYRCAQISGAHGVGTAGGLL